jgi:hypothetical protein
MINKHIQIYVVAGDNNVGNWNQTLSSAMSWHHTATLSIKLTERIKAEAIKKARLGFLQSTLPLDLDRFDSTVHSSYIDDMDVILRAQVTNAYGINTKKAAIAYATAITSVVFTFVHAVRALQLRPLVAAATGTSGGIHTATEGTCEPSAPTPPWTHWKPSVL